MATYRVLFVCLHGAAKSVIAAELLERMAEARGLEAAARAAGVEADDEIPPAVVRALLEEGCDVRGRKPASLSDDALRWATHIVSFGCEIGGARPDDVPVTMWDGVPAVSDGFDAARAAIVERLGPMVEWLAGTGMPPSPGPTLQSDHSSDDSSN